MPPCLLTGGRINSARFPYRFEVDADTAGLLAAHEKRRLELEQKHQGSALAVPTCEAFAAALDDAFRRLYPNT